MGRRMQHKIPFETASSRLGPDRMRLALVVFNRLTPENAVSWDLSTFAVFLESVLPSLPSFKLNFTKLCFEAFAQYSSMLAFRDFAVSLCVLAYGLPEERLRFAFDILDDGRNEISRDTLRIWAKVFGGAIAHDDLDFDGTLDLTQWMQWASSRLDCCVVKWVFDIADRFDLLAERSIAEPTTLSNEKESDSDEESEYLNLARLTNLHTFEVYGIAVVFKRIKALRPTETMDREGFCAAFPSVKDEKLKREAFGDYDCFNLEDFVKAICGLWEKYPDLELCLRIDLGLRPHSIQEELRVCENQLGGPHAAGDYALVESEWFADWKAEQTSRPIDNTSVVTALHGRRASIAESGKTDDTNYAVMSIPAYEALKLWYGGGPDVIRRAKQEDGQWHLDLFPLVVRCALATKLEEVLEVRVYEHEQVLDCVCAKFGLDLVYSDPPCPSSPSSPRMTSPTGSARGERTSRSCTPVRSARGPKSGVTRASSGSSRGDKSARNDRGGGSLSSTALPEQQKANYRLWVIATNHKRQTSFDPLALLRTRSSSESSKTQERPVSVNVSKCKVWQAGDPIADNQLFLLAAAEWEPPPPTDVRHRTFFRDDKKTKTSSQARGVGFFGLKAKAEEDVPVSEAATKNAENEGTLPSDEPPNVNQSNSSLGICGLCNLGNTCYMNSALQCLSHTRVLREYFLSESYLRDINNDSVWGMQGRLAVEFYDVLKMLWTSTGSVRPTEFYKTVSVFQNRFADNTQEDPQEFLILFLQGLSEDVCRIQEKPYIEIKDSAGRDDCEVATEYWNALMKRELSIVSVLFMGQFKSELSCRSCTHTSKTFDPFSCISLALSEETRTVVLPKVRLLDGRWTWLKAEMHENATIKDLRTSVAEISGKDAWVFSRDSTQLTPLREDFPLVRAQSQPLVGFLIPPGDGPLCCIIHRRLERAEQYFLDPLRPVEFGRPFLIRVSNVEDPFPEIWKKVRFMVPECPEARVFTLTTVSCKAHAACAVCPWTTGCSGCTAKLPLDFGHFNAGTSDGSFGGHIPTLALDWNDDCLRRYYNKKNSTYEVELPRISCGTVKLEHIFESFLREEIIEASCEKCNEKQCDKRMGVWGFPPYLMIQLKRFKDQGRGKHRGLVSFEVDELDLSSFLESNSGHIENTEPQCMSFTEGRYELYGVINHEGELNHGHCYAFVKLNQGSDQQWYEFSDSTITAINPEDVMTNAAYILFFLRKDVATLSLEQMFATNESKEAVDASLVRDKPAVPPQRRAACTVM